MACTNASCLPGRGSIDQTINPMHLCNRQLVRLAGCLMAVLSACAGIAAGQSSSPARAALSNLPEGIVAGNVQVVEDVSGRARLGQVLHNRSDFRDITVLVPNYHFSPSALCFHIS